MKGCLRLRSSCFDEGEIDLLYEVVPALVEAVDVVLYCDDGGIGGFRVPGHVLSMPEFEVGKVLIEQELLEWRCGDGWRMQVVMAVGVGDIVQTKNPGSIQHECERVSASRRISGLGRQRKRYTSEYLCRDWQPKGGRRNLD